MMNNQVSFQEKREWKKVLLGTSKNETPFFQYVRLGRIKASIRFGGGSYSLFYVFACAKDKNVRAAKKSIYEFEVTSATNDVLEWDALIKYTFSLVGIRVEMMVDEKGKVVYRNTNYEKSDKERKRVKVVFTFPSTYVNMLMKGNREIPIDDIPFLQDPVLLNTYEIHNKLYKKHDQLSEMALEKYDRNKYRRGKKMYYFVTYASLLMEYEPWELGTPDRRRPQRISKYMIVQRDDDTSESEDDTTDSFGFVQEGYHVYVEKDEDDTTDSFGILQNG